MEFPAGKWDVQRCAEWVVPHVCRVGDIERPATMMRWHCDQESVSSEYRSDLVKNSFVAPIPREVMAIAILVDWATRGGAEFDFNFNS